MCWPVGKAERRFAGVTHIDVGGFTRTQADDVKPCAPGTASASRPSAIIRTRWTRTRRCPRNAVSHFKKVILAAEKLGLKNANTFVGRDWTKTVDENWPRFLKTWRPIIAFAEDHGIRVGIENCPMFFSRDEWPGGKNLATTPVIWRRMFSDIPSRNFGLNYDPSHLVLQQMDPLARCASSSTSSSTCTPRT